MTRARLSVVTPAFNQATFLPATIESVLSQDEPVEYLVIDDGSTDATQAVLRTYGPKVRWTTQPNAGQTPTINRGWRELDGDVLTWLNSDDTLLPGAVRLALDYLDAHPDVDIVYGKSVFTDADGRRTEHPPQGGPFDYDDFVVDCVNPIPQPSAFIRRRVVDDIGPLDEHYYYFMDWDYWLRAGIRHRICYIDEVLSTYRLHDASKSVAGNLRAAPELAYMYERFFARADLPSRLSGARRRAMANMCLTMGGYHNRGGDPAAARRDALAATRWWPPVVGTRRGAHAIAYCAAGESAPYRAVREWRARHVTVAR